MHGSKTGLGRRSGVVVLTPGWFISFGKTGESIDAAKKAGFKVLVTADKNLRYR